MTNAVEISHSRMQAYERCPWMYHLIFDEGWRSGPSAKAALGQSIHRTLDKYLSPENTEKSLPRLLEIFDEQWVNEGFDSPQATMEAYQSGQTILEKFFELDKDRTSEVVSTEKEFNIELPGPVQLRGTIDRLDIHKDGTYEIIEYKTQSPPWNESRIAQDQQMTLYALGMTETLKGAPLKLTYYFLSSGTSIETIRTQQQLEEARARILSVAEKIKQHQFNPNHNYCSHCEFGKRCVHFKST
ncbi:MAG: hypothetical protein KCHDKBKB_02214 [Elusimicrobia bacterium]|nr:hypothetical protein [Elusimicrobiota bacterium]